MTRQLKTAAGEPGTRAEDCPSRVPHIPHPEWVPYDCSAAVVVSATLYSL